MTNKKYRRGYAKEKKCQQQLKDAGYNSIRAGGSKGIDIFAWSTIFAEQPLFRAIMVTCQKKNIYHKINSDRIKLLKANFPSMVSLEIWIDRPYKPIEIVRIER